MWKKMFEGQFVRAQMRMSMNWGVFNLIPGKV
jgi:hypothetical protein